MTHIHTQQSLLLTPKVVGFVFFFLNMCNLALRLRESLFCSEVKIYTLLKDAIEMEFRVDRKS